MNIGFPGDKENGAVTDGEGILAKLHQLPVIPVVVQEVISSFNDPDLDSAALAHKIAQDQGLTAKVLRVANSAFYGLPRQISSMQDAVLVMGFNHIRSLALSAGFVLAFPVTGSSRFDRHAYWKHSFRVAAYAKALAKCLRHDQEMAFMAGMFHDIGQLVLDTCMREQFAGALEQQQASGQNLIEIEQMLFGFDHVLIGAEVARRWNFPRAMEHAIRHWRIPEHEPFEPVTGMVHVAALLAGGFSGEALMGNLPATLRERLQVTWERIEACLPEPDQLDAGTNLMLPA